VYIIFFTPSADKFLFWLQRYRCVVKVDVLVKSDFVSLLLNVTSDHCIMLMNPVDIADIPSYFQHGLLQLALPVSCRSGIIQQLCDDPSAVSLVCSPLVIISDQLTFENL